MVIAACLAWTRPHRVFTMAAEAPTAAVGRWQSLLWSAAEVPGRRAACPRREAGSIEGSAAGRSPRPAFLGDPSFAWPVIRRPDGCVAGLSAGPIAGIWRDWRAVPCGVSFVFGYATKSSPGPTYYLAAGFQLPTGDRLPPIERLTVLILSAVTSAP